PTVTSPPRRAGGRAHRGGGIPRLDHPGGPRSPRPCHRPPRGTFTGGPRGDHPAPGTPHNSAIRGLRLIGLHRGTGPLILPLDVGLQLHCFHTPDPTTTDLDRRQLTGAHQRTHLGD